MNGVVIFYKLAEQDIVILLTELGTKGLYNFLI